MAGSECVLKQQGYASCTSTILDYGPASSSGLPGLCTDKFYRASPRVDFKKWRKNPHRFSLFFFAQKNRVVGKISDTGYRVGFFYRVKSVQPDNPLATFSHWNSFRWNSCVIWGGATIEGIPKSEVYQKFGIYFRLCSEKNTFDVI